MNLLKLPETKNLTDLNDPKTTLIHAEIVQQKPFLKKLYIDFYNELISPLSNLSPNAKILELGSGGGFIKELSPNVITSEILDISGVDLHLSGTNMPFHDNTLDAIIMIDVLHHIPNSREFLKEAKRCLKKEGKLIMVEPANTPFSRFIYKNFHHEPFEPNGKWGFDSEGPLSSANGAIPWIIFSRDREAFNNEFPDFTINKLQNHTPLRYLLSGGLSLKQLVPSFSYSFFCFIEFLLSPLNNLIGMFQTIELTKET